MFTFDSDGNTVIVLERAARTGASVAAVLACVPVRDLDVATEFYRVVLGRGPDASPMPGLAGWHVGGGLVTLQVTDLGPTVAALSDRGVEVRAQEGAPVAGFAFPDDPDGNLVTLVQTAP